MASEHLTPGLAKVLRATYDRAFEKDWFENGLIAMGPARLAREIAIELWKKDIPYDFDEYTIELRHQIWHLDHEGVWDLPSLKKFA